MHQSFVTTAPPPPHTHTYGDGRIAGLICGAVTFWVFPQCRVSAGLVMLSKYTPVEFTIIKGCSTGLWLMKTPRFPRRWRGGGWSGGAAGGSRGYKWLLHNALTHYKIHTFCFTAFSPIGDCVLQSKKWAASWQNQQNGMCTSEDSDQPGYPPSLIRVFAVHMKKAWVLSYPLNAQRRLWSDWADAQADLSLRWAHSYFVAFAMRRLKLCKKKKDQLNVNTWTQYTLD